jgi:hypothetical protein
VTKFLSQTDAGSNKIVNLANGSGAQDAAAFGQIPLIDSTGTDIQPAGVQAAGSKGQAADAKHVHPDLNLLLAPTGATAQTFAGRGCAGTPGGPSTGQVTMVAIPMAAGIAVNNITLVVFSIAVTPTHGWYALCDSGRNVVAVSSDTTTTGFLSTGAVTLSVSASAYTTTYSGLYYLAVSTTAATPAKFFVQNAFSTTPVGIAPILCGLSGTQNAPPALAATMTAITANGGFYYYGYTS